MNKTFIVTQKLNINGTIICVIINNFVSQGTSLEVKLWAISVPIRHLKAVLTPRKCFHALNL